MIVTELRICNYVFANGKIDQVSEITSFGVDVFKCKDIAIIVNPIPLTEEWLLKFGFKKVLSGLFWSNQWITLNMDFEQYFTDGNYHDYLVGNKIEYVHQLQNLNFSISVGEELTIKTEKK